MFEFPAPRRIEIPPKDDYEGIGLSVHEAGDGPAVVFSHGFPELAFSWRHQLSATAAAGFRAIAPDQRGYGRSDRPDRIEAYDLPHLCGDLAGLLDVLEIDRAVFVGHDWGGFVAWAMPILHPDRVAGVVGVCTPYMALPRTETMRALTGDDPDSLYMLWFQEPGVAEAAMDPAVRTLFDRMMRGGLSPDEILARRATTGSLDMNPFRRIGEFEALGEPIVTPEELDDYVEQFERSGFRGGINWYRNIDRNVACVPDLGTRKLELPCLMVTAEWDLALRPELAAGMPALVYGPRDRAGGESRPLDPTRTPRRIQRDPPRVARAEIRPAMSASQRAMLTREHEQAIGAV